MSSFVETQFGLRPEMNEFAVNSLIPFPYAVGVEIELEFEGRFPEVRNAEGNAFRFWDVKHDGSLKNGLEYVFRSPLVSQSVVDALVEFKAHLKAEKVKPRMSERTSVHVHIDARDMTKKQIQNFVLLYLVFEKVLFNFSGEERKDNVFCLSAMSSDVLVAALSQFFNSEDADAAYYLRDYHRYTSMNLNSLTRFGSIEIRSHKGTHSPNRIISWVNILLSLKQYVMNNEEIWEALPENISNVGPEEFMRQVFGKYTKHLNYVGADNDIIDGVRIAQDVIHSNKYRELEKKVAKLTLNKESALFMKYMARKYPNLYQQKEEAKGIKKTVVGNESTYTVDYHNMRVDTKKGKSYNLMEDKKGWFFINVLKTKVYLSEGAQGLANMHRDASINTPPPPTPQRVRGHAYAARPRTAGEIRERDVRRGADNARAARVRLQGAYMADVVQDENPVEAIPEVDVEAFEPNEMWIPANDIGEIR